MSLDNFSSTECSCNEKMHLCEKENEKIVIGASNTNTFKLDFLISYYCSSVSIVYYQSISETLRFEANIPNEDENSKIKIIENSCKNVTYVDVNINVEDSLKFVDYRSTFAQIKFNLKDGSVILSDKFAIDMVGSFEQIGD